MEGQDKAREMTSEGRFVEQIWNIFKSINNNKILGNYHEFFNGIEALQSMLGQTYGTDDKKYKEEKEKLYNKLYDKDGELKDADDPNQNKTEIKFIYYNELFEILIRLLRRTPLMPMKIVEGVIEEDDFKDV